MTTAIVSVLYGDATMLGYGSTTASIRSTTPTVPDNAWIWNKWTQSSGANRDALTDSGDGLVAITNAQGSAATDVGPEFVFAADRANNFRDATYVVIKHARAGANVCVDESTALNTYHPSVASSANTLLTTHYIADALAWLRTQYDTVQADGIFVSIGLADAAAGSGAGEAFAAGLRASIRAVRTALGNDNVNAIGAVPPLVDRASYPDIDVVRYGYELLNREGVLRKVIDTDHFERGGLAGGSTPSPLYLNGEGTVKLGSALAGAMQHVRTVTL